MERLLFLSLYFDDRWNVSAKTAPYQPGEYIGVEKEEKLCKGTVALMVVGLKYIAFIGQTIPKVTFNE